MKPFHVDLDALTAWLAQTAYGDLALPCGRDGLAAFFHQCLEVGQRTDSLRDILPALDACWKASGLSSSSQAIPDTLLVPACALAAEGYQLGHQGACHKSAAAAITASLCKALTPDAHESPLLIRELRNGFLMMQQILDRPTMSLFASLPDRETAFSLMTGGLNAAPPEAGAFCAACAILSCFHQAFIQCF